MHALPDKFVSVASDHTMDSSLGHKTYKRALHLDDDQWTEFLDVLSVYI